MAPVGAAYPCARHHPQQSVRCRRSLGAYLTALEGLTPKIEAIAVTDYYITDITAPQPVEGADAEGTWGLRSSRDELVGWGDGGTPTRCPWVGRCPGSLSLTQPAHLVAHNVSPRDHRVSTLITSGNLDQAFAGCEGMFDVR